LPPPVHGFEQFTDLLVSYTDTELGELKRLLKTNLFLVAENLVYCASCINLLTYLLIASCDSFVENNC